MHLPPLYKSRLQEHSYSFEAASVSNSTFRRNEMTETSEFSQTQLPKHVSEKPNGDFLRRMKAPLMTHGQVIPAAFIGKASDRKH